MGELHDDIRDSEGEEHEEDVEVDEAEPVEQGFPDAGSRVWGSECAMLLARCGVVGRG